MSPLHARLTGRDQPPVLSGAKIILGAILSAAATFGLFWGGAILAVMAGVPL